MTAEAGSLRAAVAGGVDFLLGLQGDDGLWRDFRTPAGAATSWPSAYAGCALRSAGAHGTWLDRLSDALERTQHPDGGWGYHEGTPTDADSTSWGVLALAGRKNVAEVRARALACLARHQRPRGGGVATYAEAGPVRRFTGLSRAVPFWGWRRPHVEIAAVAGRALHGSGSAGARDRAVRAWRFVRSRQQDDGSWPSYWWTSEHVATEQAVRLAVLMADPEPAARAARWVQRHQGADGAWRDPAGEGASAFLTALSVSILAATGSDDAGLARGVDALIRLQDVGGGWPATATLRIPVPPDRHPSLDGAWRPVRFGPGLVVPDQERVFTTATCVAALASVSTTPGRHGPQARAVAGP